jgi:hypothetical protein
MNVTLLSQKNNTNVICVTTPDAILGEVSCQYEKYDQLLTSTQGGLNPCDLEGIRSARGFAYNAAKLGQGQNRHVALILFQEA